MGLHTGRPLTSCSAFGFGVTGILLGSVLIFFNWKTLDQLPARPLELSIDDVVSHNFAEGHSPHWVTVIGGIWDCGNIRYESSGRSVNTFAVLTNAERSIIMNTELSGRLTCAQVQSIVPSGFLSKMTDRRQSKFLELEGFDFAKYKSSPSYYDLCAFCGRNNSTGGIILGSTFAVLGLFLCSGFVVSVARHGLQYALQRY